MTSKSLKEWVTEVNNFLKNLNDAPQQFSATKVGSYWTGGNITVERRGRIVTIRIRSLTTSTLSGRTTIATIPAGYRPAGECYGIFTDMTHYFMVEENGEIRVNETVSPGRWGSISYVAFN